MASTATMATTKAEEKWIDLPDGHKLYTKSWTPAQRPRAQLLLVHGFSDHCNCYGAFIDRLTSQAIQVHSYDQRGFGRSVHSPKQRGLTGPTQRVLDDLTFAVRNLPSGAGASDDDEAAPATPLFMLGHSMGGGIVPTWAAEAPRDAVARVRGFLLEAPLLAVSPATQPWRVTVALGRLVSRLLPHAQLVRRLDASFMSRDPEVCRAWEADPLCHDTGTLEGIAYMLDRADGLLRGRIVLREGLGEGGKTRLWVGHGTGDGVVSYDASRSWFDGLQVEDKEFKTYDGWYHKLHDEAGEDRTRFADDVAKWMLDRCAPAKATVDSSATRPKL